MLGDETLATITGLSRAVNLIADVKRWHFDLVVEVVMVCGLEEKMEMAWSLETSGLTVAVVN